jgi:hypothetical protein
MKTWLILAVSLIAAGAAAQEYRLDADPPAQHLYFTELAQMNRFETVTVFITAGAFDKRIADAFYVFAKRIGKDNGATRVDAANYDKYAELLTRLACRPIRAGELPAVVFTARSAKYCQVFSLADPAALREVLFSIERNLSCPKNVAVERIRQDARASVKDLADSLGPVKALLRPSNEFIDFFAEQLRRTCPS